ncbi:MAG: ankyrin repeat domain-containing protein [Methylococcales bacterium]|nr:ankyrin repeat domain-containing protein [Methylococcales bacterium]
MSGTKSGNIYVERVEKAPSLKLPTQALDALLQTGADACVVGQKGSNALMGVAFKGHDQVAKWLLENTDYNVNHQNYAGQTALMMASLFGREDMIKLLLEYGENRDLIDNQGNTSIKLAQAQGLSRIVEIIQFHLQKKNEVQ